MRGAIRALEEVGFLDRAVVGGGSKHRVAGDGALHRKPVMFQFGSDYAAAFSMANTRAHKVRERQSKLRRTPPTGNAQRVSAGLSEPFLRSPKNRVSEASQVLMGEITKLPPKRTEPNAALEAALERWGMALRGRDG